MCVCMRVCVAWQCMAPFDLMSAEQTWPTDEEMKEASIQQVGMNEALLRVVGPGPAL